ncbi:polysaccharide deacetylase family protein [Shouchella shacheensis]|uniref:polysaccharide deacetylase family protein n=1 Tax=Shouchella shacheensis TaxID=1649580 RepID=UPI0007404D2D|nr:polysaccharide deacetylase family protein [Shouchella shacheensis]
MKGKAVAIIAVLLLASACTDQEEERTARVSTEKLTVGAQKEVFSREAVDWSDFERMPLEWGEKVTGVKNRLDTTDQVVALTFDACGGEHGEEVDIDLLDFLRAHEIKATLFLNERWIKANESLFAELAEDPLFELANHGSEHKPLSVSGESAWGIEGTDSVSAVVQEVQANQETMKERTGEEAAYFRSGTAYYDEVAVEITEALGLEVVNYSLLGDAGATFSASQVEKALLIAQPGDIALLHMNRPQSGTGRGVQEAIPQLETQGFSFAHLSGYALIP